MDASAKNFRRLIPAAKVGASSPVRPLLGHLPDEQLGRAAVRRLPALFQKRAPMQITINKPGYWAHGKTFEATREVLVISIRPGVKQDSWLPEQWKTSPYAENQHQVEVYIADVPKWGRVAFPASYCQ